MWGDGDGDMELELLRTKLEAILDKKVTAHEAALVPAPGVETFAAEDGVIAVHGELTETERNLIALLLEQGRRTERKGKGGAVDEELQSALLSAWLLERLDHGDHDAALPDALARWPKLGGVKLPLLLYGEYSERQTSAVYDELKKLLKSFFEADVVLVPLHAKEWLILADETLLAQERDGEEETLEDAISALASGLQDMAANEWVGECHVAATYPVSPGTSLVQTAAALRETVELGRAYRVSSYIHMPWELRLETLLDAAPRKAKLRFLEGVLRRAEPAFETEMLLTIEAFFAENCNVSDTAKRLYIHRNTLLYRLDKFKQETGMDVRDFDHAVLVRLALMLYKVTKRK